MELFYCIQGQQFAEKSYIYFDITIEAVKKNQLGQQPLFFNGVQSPTYDFLTSQWCKSNAYSGATVSEHHTTILVFTFKDGVW